MSTHWLQRFHPVAIVGLVLLLLCLFAGDAHSQLLQPQIITAHVNSLSFSDVDLVNATAPKWLFTVSVTSGLSPVVTSATMTVKISVQLANGESYPNAVQVFTKPFPVPKTVTNLDITNKIGIEIDHSIFDEKAKQRFKDLALATTAMPPGTYTFDIQVAPATGGSPVSGQFILVLSNPSSIDLVFPADGDPSVSQLPLFQWRYDGPRSRISIFEKRPQQSSLQDAAGGVPELSTEVTTTSFQYPSAGARALEPGKTYVWYVEGLSGTSGGAAAAIRSELRSFTVSAAGASSWLSYLDDLERALDSKYKPVFDQIRAEGLLPTGIIRMNGTPISTIELLDIIRGLRQNPEAVQFVGLEQ